MAKDFVQMDMFGLLAAEVVTAPPVVIAASQPTKSMVDGYPMRGLGRLEISPPNPATAPLSSDRYVEPDKDGITTERVETIIIPVPKYCQSRLQIYVAQGDSGVWYFGLHIYLACGSGNSYYPCPKFSDKFTTRDEAITGAIKSMVAWCNTPPVGQDPKKDIKDVLAALDAFTEKDVVIQSTDLPNAAAIEALVRNQFFTTNQAKVLCGGFSLAWLNREKKAVYRTRRNPVDGSYLVGIYPTFAAAERLLKEQIQEPGCIEMTEAGVISLGHGNNTKLYAAGFEFYRVYGLREYDYSNCCIKQGSKNWSNWNKYTSPKELQLAWDTLLSEDMKALEG